MPKVALPACCSFRRHGSPPLCLAGLLDVWTDRFAIASARPGCSISTPRAFHSARRGPFENWPPEAGRDAPKPSELSERISLLVGALKKLQRKQNPPRQDGGDQAETGGSGFWPVQEEAAQHDPDNPAFWRMQEAAARSSRSSSAVRRIRQNLSRHLSPGTTPREEGFGQDIHMASLHPRRHTIHKRLRLTRGSVKTRFRIILSTHGRFKRVFPSNTYAHHVLNPVVEQNQSTSSVEQGTYNRHRYKKVRLDIAYKLLRLNSPWVVRRTLSKADNPIRLFRSRRRTSRLRKRKPFLQSRPLRHNRKYRIWQISFNGFWRKRLTHVDLDVRRVLLRNQKLKEDDKVESTSETQNKPLGAPEKRIVTAATRLNLDAGTTPVKRFRFGPKRERAVKEESAEKQRIKRLRFGHPTAKMSGGSQMAAESSIPDHTTKRLRFAPPRPPAATSRGPPEIVSADGGRKPLLMRRLLLGGRQLRKAKRLRTQLASIPTAEIDNPPLATDVGDDCYDHEYSSRGLEVRPVSCGWAWLSSP